MSFAKQVAFKVSRAIAGHRRRRPRWTDLFDAQPRRVIPVSPTEAAKIGRVFRLIVVLVVALIVMVMAAGAYQESVKPRKVYHGMEWEFASPDGRTPEQVREDYDKDTARVRARIEMEEAARGGGLKTPFAERPEHR